MTVFNRKDLERGIQSHLDDWIVPWLAQVERDEGLDPRTIAAPRSWDVRTDFTRNPEDTLPLVAVISTGTSPGQRPRRDGDGNVTAWWLVAVGAVVSARSHQEANDLAGFYGAAIRGAVTLQDLEWANGVDWENEAFDDLPSIQSRNLATVREVFTIEVSGSINLFDGFGVLPTDPYQAPPADPTVGAGKATVDVGFGG